MGFVNFGIGNNAVRNDHIRYGIGPLIPNAHGLAAVIVARMRIDAARLYTLDH